VKKVSDKRKAQNKAYKAVRDKFMLDNPICERCGGKSMENHHKNGRNGERLTDVTYFMAVCRDCHVWIHAQPKEAREVGWLI
jgi:ribosomal protein S27AE